MRRIEAAMGMEQRRSGRQKCSKMCIRDRRKIVQGGADKSYGIQVAKLAGVPDSVIQRAKELVEELSDADITAAVKDLTSAKKKKPVYDQMCIRDSRCSLGG